MQKIDFVIAWLDGNDPAWQQEMQSYKEQMPKGRGDVSPARFRNVQLLRYWLRGVEKFAPWVHKIYFVTGQEVPGWLQTEHPRLQVVHHHDFIPKQYLPTFNSHTIELNFHRIQGLSETFVYFNDDLFLTRPVKPEDFFYNGKPKGMLALQPVVANKDNEEMPYIYLNNAMVLARHFDKRSCIKQRPGDYFHIGYPLQYFIYNGLELAFPRYTGFHEEHSVSPMLRSMYEKIWEMEPEILDATCRCKFRQKENVNQYLINEWTKLSGNFVPSGKRNLKYFELGRDDEAMLEWLRHPRKPIVCINDSNMEYDVDSMTKALQERMEALLPEPSVFEKEEG